MSHKKIKNITVRTVPNGYTLNYEGQKGDGYLYFDAESLVAGMLKHVVLNDKSEQDPELCRNLMQSMMTWPEGSDLHEANAKLLSDIEESRRTAYSAQQQLSSISKKYEMQCTEIRDLKERLALATTRLENYDRERREAERQAEIERVKERRKQIKLETEAEHKSKMVKVKPADDTDDEVVNKIKAERASKARAAKAAKKAEREAEKPKAQPKPKTAKPKKTTKAKPKAVKYSEAVYNALMIPLTIDRMHGVSLRTLKILKLAGGQINETVGDVARYTLKEMLLQRGCGSAVIKEWETWLDDHGLQMGMNVKAIIKQHDKE